MCGAMQTRPSGCSAAASNCVAPWYEKPYIPIRPLQAACLAQPCYRLGPISSLMAERIKLALGTASPPHILDRNMIPVPRKPDRMRIHHGRRDVAPVRLAHQQRRPRSLRRRQDNNGPRPALCHRSAGTATPRSSRTPISAVDQCHGLSSMLRFEVVHRHQRFRNSARRFVHPPLAILRCRRRGIAHHAARRNVLGQPCKVRRRSLRLQQFRLIHARNVVSACTRRSCTSSGVPCSRNAVSISPA